MSQEQTQSGQDVIFALKQALVHEEVNGPFELGVLEESFYTNLRLKMVDLTGVELTNATKAMRKLMSKRTAKIIRIASLSKLTQLVEVKLASEEKALYNNVHMSCNMFRDIVTKGEQNVKE